MQSTRSARNELWSEHRRLAAKHCLPAGGILIPLQRCHVTAGFLAYSVISSKNSLNVFFFGVPACFFSKANKSMKEQSKKAKIV